MRDAGQELGLDEQRFLQADHLERILDIVWFATEKSGFRMGFCSVENERLALPDASELIVMVGLDGNGCVNNAETGELLIDRTSNCSCAILPPGKMPHLQAEGAIKLGFYIYPMAYFRQIAAKFSPDQAIGLPEILTAQSDNWLDVFASICFLDTNTALGKYSPARENAAQLVGFHLLDRYGKPLSTG